MDPDDRIIMELQCIYLGGALCQACRKEIDIGTVEGVSLSPPVKIFSILSIPRLDFQ